MISKALSARLSSRSRGTVADVRWTPAAASRFEQAERSPRFRRTPHKGSMCPPADDSTYLRGRASSSSSLLSDARTIEFRPLEHATQHTLTTYLLGQVLSFSLLSFGCEPLHATAVVVDGSAVAFLGDCGDGKSTLGAAFLARGYPLLTDDVLALQFDRTGVIAHAGPARLKLFPSVARSLLGRTGTRRLNPGTRKLVLR